MGEINIIRNANKTKDGKIELISEFKETISEDEFNIKLIEAYSEKEKLKSQLELLKAKVNRLSKEVKPNKELIEFERKLVAVEKLKDKNRCIEQAKKWEETVNTMEKDVIKLRLIQSEIFPKERDKMVNAKTVGNTQ